MFRFTLLCVCAFNMISCQTPALPGPEQDVVEAAPLTVFLVRHAEKESGSDPVLSAEGEARALLLTTMMEEIKLDAIFSTPYRRTELTADPVAKNHGLPILSYDPSDLPGFAEKLKTEYQGKTVLVVGHSNTTPTLTGILDGTNAYPGFSEYDYGNIMLVTLPPKGKHKTVCLRY